MTITALKNFSAVKTACQISLRTLTPVYLVGGTLRDTMMGFFYGKDFDFVVPGDMLDCIAEAFAKSLNGKIIPWNPNQTRIVFKENGQNISADFSRLKGPDIKSDLKQRDFTINAIAIDLKSFFDDEKAEVLDPLGGLQDLNNKMIKGCSKKIFDDDPLRILRGIRFAGQFQFNIDRPTFDLMQQKALLIERVARERIKRELFDVLQLPCASRAIKTLLDVGIIDTLIPELLDFASVTQGPPHRLNLLEHSLKTVEILDDVLQKNNETLISNKDKIIDYINYQVEEKVSRRSLLIFAGLMHDIGKTVSRSETGGRITFYGHEGQGARINKGIAERLGLGSRAQAIIEKITTNHMRLLQLSQPAQITDRAKMRFLKDVEDVALEVILLAVSDAKAKGTDDVNAANGNTLNMLAKELAGMILSPSVESKKTAAISGHEVMKNLGISEGPQVGAVLREIHQGERAGFFESREDVIKWLKKKKKP